MSHLPDADIVKREIEEEKPGRTEMISFDCILDIGRLQDEINLIGFRFANSLLKYRIQKPKH